MTRGRAARALAASALVTALVAASPTTAAAGTYTVSSCRGFDGAPASAAGWSPDLRDDPATSWAWPEGLTACASGGELSVALRGSGPWAVGEGAAMTYAVPPPLRITGILGLDRETRGLGPGPGAAEQVWWVVEAGGRWLDACAPSIPALDCAGTGFNAPPGEVRGDQMDARGFPAGAITFSVACHAGAGNASCARPPWTADGPRGTVRGLVVRIEDPADPVVGAVTGSLADDAVVRGTAGLTVEAGDDGAGLAGMAALIDDAPVAAAAIGGAMCADAQPADGDPRQYLVAQPCPESAVRSLAVDTTVLAEGEHRLVVRVDDAAGNTAVALDRRLVVDNHPRAPGDDAGGAPSGSGAPAGGPGHRPNGTHASERARVTAWLEWQGRRTRTVRAPAGVRVRIRGRLTDEHGRPIGGAAIALVERRRGGAPPATGVRTRPNGRFTTFTRLGPSRDLQFEYRAFADTEHPRRSPLLHLRVQR